MTDDEARHHREELESVLQKHGLGWIIDEAGQRIALGKSARKQVSTFDEEFDVVTAQPRAARRRREVFVTTEEFTDVERLRILVEAVELGVVGPAKMQEASFENLGEEIGTISFADDRTGEVQVALDRRSSAVAALSANGIETLLSRLRDSV